MSRRAHTPPAAAFDWPRFVRTFRYQPVPVWIASTLLLRPASRATPFLLRASCAGPAREIVANFALVAYALVLPAAAAALVYLLAGRRRMTGPLRRMGDWCLALVLLISAINDAGLLRGAAASWTTMRPGLSALRAACWK